MHKLNHRLSLTVILLLIIHTTLLSSDRKTRVVIRTESGDITIRINCRKAPLTSANFLQYVDARKYDSTFIYRIVRLDNQPDNKIKIEVIQGGRFEKENDGFPPVIHENTKMTGLRHMNGTISMARLEPGTATSEFFICIGRQRELDFGGKRNPDGQGFAAFGRVVRGMKVVRNIHSRETPGQYPGKKILIYTISRK
ncbi:MAG: peptidylprolyl isomerase [Bacteroidales bacterium]